jgi:lipopolysaccharide transport system ATP-binding protein
MGEVANLGRTVLFVSHNIGAINSLTQKCIHMKDGKIAGYGESTKLVQDYLSLSVEKAQVDRKGLDYYRRDKGAKPPIKITDIWVDKSSENIANLRFGEAFSLNFRLRVFRDIHGAHLNMLFKNEKGERIALISSLDENFSLFLSPGEHIVSASIDDLWMAPGLYFVDVGVTQASDLRSYDVILDFPVLKITNNGKLTQWLDRPWAAVHCDNIKWQMKNN